MTDEVIAALRKQGANLERRAIVTMVRRLMKASNPMTAAMLRGLVNAIKGRK